MVIKGVATDEDINIQHNLFAAFWDQTRSWERGICTIFPADDRRDVVNTCESSIHKIQPKSESQCQDSSNVERTFNGEEAGIE